MSQFAKQNPEVIAEIAALPMAEQGAAMRDAMSSISTRHFRCEDCRVRWTLKPLSSGRPTTCPNCGGTLGHE